MTPDAVLPVLGRIAAEAGARIVAVRDAGFRTVAKADASPLTEADLAAEAVIAARLAAWLPGLHVVSEEAAIVAPPAGAPFLLVDPLDGTREFVGASGEFTVNLALIVDGRAVAGVVFAPALGRVWAGARGFGARAGALVAGAAFALDALSPVAARRAPRDGVVAVASRSHLDGETEAFLGRLRVRDRRSVGSSLKFCLVAEGEADVYPRFGTTMEWDTAAGPAVLEAAGGRVETPEGAPFRYGKAGFRNGPFVAWGE